MGRRPNYSFEKRQRELKKQKKKEKKLAKKGQVTQPEREPPGPPAATDPAAKDGD